MAHLEFRSGETVLEFHGELVFDTVPDLYRQAAAAAGVQKIDLSRIEKLDSAGAALLLWVSDHFTQDRERIRISGLGENASNLLRVAGLESLLD